MRTRAAGTLRGALRPNPNYKSRGDEKSEARAEGMRGLREGRVRARLHRSRIDRRLRVQAIRLKFTSDSLHTAYRFRGRHQICNLRIRAATSQDHRPPQRLHVQVGNIAEMAQ